MLPDTPEQPDFSGEALELADLLNTVLDKGVIVHGDVTLAVADIDLVKLNLGLLLSALETVESQPAGRPSQTRSLANIFGPPKFGPPASAAQAGGSEGAGGRALHTFSAPARPLGAAEPQAFRATPSSQKPSQPTHPEPPQSVVAHGLPERINTDAPGIESGLARLVLTLIEVLRKVLEHQAIRRMDGGKLSPEEVERLGLALSRLNDKMQDLKKVFALTDEDLQIDLGPLGHLR